MFSLIMKASIFDQKLKPITLDTKKPDKFFMKILDTKNDHLRRLDDDKLYCASFTPLLESTYGCFL